MCSYCTETLNHTLSFSFLHSVFRPFVRTLLLLFFFRFLILKMLKWFEAAHFPNYFGCGAVYISSQCSLSNLFSYFKQTKRNLFIRTTNRDFTYIIILLYNVRLVFFSYRFFFLILDCSRFVLLLWFWFSMFILHFSQRMYWTNDNRIALTLSTLCVRLVQ